MSGEIQIITELARDYIKNGNDVNTSITLAIRDFEKALDETLDNKVAKPRKATKPCRLIINDNLSNNKETMIAKELASIINNFGIIRDKEELLEYVKDCVKIEKLEVANKIGRKPNPVSAKNIFNCLYNETQRVICERG